MDIRNEIESTQRNEAIEARERFEANIGNVWGHSSLGLEAKKAAMAMLSTKTGLYVKLILVLIQIHVHYFLTG